MLSKTQARAFFLTGTAVCGVAFVGNIVGAARKTVDRRHGRPQIAWQQERGHGKVLVVRDGRGLHGGRLCLQADRGRFA